MCAFTSEQSNVTIMKSKPEQRGLNYLGWQGNERKVRGDIWFTGSIQASQFSPPEEFYLNKGEHSNDSNDYIYKTKYGCPYICTNKSNGILMHTAGIDHSVHYC